MSHEHAHAMAAGIMFIAALAIVFLGFRQLLRKPKPIILFRVRPITFRTDYKIDEYEQDPISGRVFEVRRDQKNGMVIRRYEVGMRSGDDVIFYDGRENSSGRVTVVGDHFSASGEFLTTERHLAELERSRRGLPRERSPRSAAN